jgi:hypothetical protein
MSSTPRTEPTADALEQRDTWRVLWQSLTSDWPLALLCLVAALALVAAFVLPQMPGEGTADPLAYSQWQTEARAFSGGLYTPFLNLGLFGVYQAWGLRIVLALLVTLVVLRLADRVARLASMRRTGDALRDEERLRVTDSAPALDALAAYLRKRHYRVVGPCAIGADDRCWLSADRAPWAEILSIILHLGLLVGVAGILLNVMLGWSVARQQIDTDVAAVLAHGNVGVQLQSVDPNQAAAVVKLDDPAVAAPVQLPLGQPVLLGPLSALPLPCCLSLRLNEITPGFRISAADASGKPLTITLSSYAGPGQDAVLTFRRDEPARLVGIEESSLGLLVSGVDGGRVQAFAVPSGDVLTDTLIRPSLVISNTTLTFTPTTGAVVAAQYRPGDVPLWAGGALALLGWLAALLYPMQRLLVRHHGHWTEFYASGRRVRNVVRAILRQPPV